MIPLLDRIDRELAQCADPLRRGELLADRAGYLARLGEMAAAKVAIDELRTQFSGGAHARVWTWIQIAEALVLFFDNVDSRSRDRLLRANALAIGGGFADLASIASAWLAHVEFNASAFPAMASAIRQAIDRGAAAIPAAKLRVLVVLADANLHAGRIEVSQRFYEAARRLSVELGDEVAIAAILYNRAALTLNLVRLAGVGVNIGDSTAAKYLSLHISSAYNFHTAAGHKSLPHLLEVATARLLISEGRFGDAVKLLGPLLDQSPQSIGGVDAAVLNLEYALCLVEVGERDGALSRLQSLPLRELDHLASDEKLIYFALHQALEERLGDQTQPDGLGFSISELRQQHTSAMRDLGLLLDPLLTFD